MGFSAIGLEVGGFEIRWYSLILVGSALVGILLAARLARRMDQDPEHAWSGGVWCLTFGIIGARLWFVCFPPESVVAVGRTAAWQLIHFFDLNQGAIAVWMGGLGIVGGVAGAALGLFLYCRRQRLPFLLWLDVGAIALSLMQTIGRWGNGLNQDLYGSLTNLPWGILITDPTQRVGPYTNLTTFPLITTYFHPLYVYESLLTAVILVIMLIVFFRSQNNHRPGDITLLYLLLYSPGRFLLEFLRVNPSLVAGINVTQVILAVTFAFAVLQYRRPRSDKRPT